MLSIAFVDTEIEYKSKRILDIGGIKDDGSTFHSSAVSAFITFLKGVRFVCGHNIFNHDLLYIKNALADAGIKDADIIDTLFLSALLFPAKPSHALLKDDKLVPDEANNPLNDSIKAKDLLFDEIAAFNQKPEPLKQIFYLLLKGKKEFKAFFNLIGYANASANPEGIIRDYFKNEICDSVDLTKLVESNSIELAYCLALIDCKTRHSISPRWLIKNYPDVERILILLRSNPCVQGCSYCSRRLNIHQALKRYFGFDSFRTYAGEALQEKAVQAAVENRSILAIFPTGGGKSLTFQVPALMSGESAKGLTVVISPLQSLMKDQVDNLEKAGITEAVTINGLLDPIERAKSIERVEDGSACILYISPESLRSKTIEHLLLGRKIARFVVDEAHCFSSWGQDFRVDYLYIGEFIMSLQTKKQLQESIPVSCFTATAKQKVIQDIRRYFKEKLNLELEVFKSKTSRTNLHYKVFPKQDEEEKYNTLRDLVEQKNCPAIIYVSRTKKAYALAERLTKDGFNARPYHGKMDAKEKTENQNAFISGEVQIMVATSAFGMGVDKKDVQMVIHYEISDSLENYVQEAGRAGRDENLTADCFVLFNEEDLGKHFILLNQTKLTIKEIQQVWKAIKAITHFRETASNSALEIARKAGWDDNIADIETRVTTAIAALEDAGYLARGQNMPQVFANSILAKTAQEAIDKINKSDKFEEKQKVTATRIIKKLFSSKSRKHSTDEVAESRVDYISDHLGIVKEEVINIITLLREENILADAKDLTAFIKKSENKNRSLAIVETFGKIENFLLPFFEEEEITFNVKALNEQGEAEGIDITPNRIKTVINFWSIKNWIKKYKPGYSKNEIAIMLSQPRELLQNKLQKRHELARFIVGYLYDKINYDDKDNVQEEVLIEFSVHELKQAFERRATLFQMDVTLGDIEDTLFYLSRIEAIKIEGGFLVLYNKLTVNRLEKDNRKQYKNEDYLKLREHYEHKIQQIHIVGEYAKKMISDYKGALQFADDYFQLNYSSFLNKYFPGGRLDDIKRNLTPAKFKQIFGSLSATQLKIVKDTQSKYIVVAAGPGSGKTRLLLHKLASLLLTEDVKHEQLLMVTFSRAAATEFKKRLVELIGNAANYIEIKTFHSYCFDVLGKVGTLKESDTVLKAAVEKIKRGEADTSRITKTVLVIDEAQDMDADGYALIEALMEQNEDMRVIAVGDDDQNIYEFRGSDSRYLMQLITEKQATKYELIENYRSKNNLVEYTNRFVQKLTRRLKENMIIATQSDNGLVKVIRYSGSNLITPLVNDILSMDLSGSTCVLTSKNYQAEQVTGLLLKKGQPAKLIQDFNNFNLYNLCEVRYFIDVLKRNEEVYIVDDETWVEAKRKLTSQFKTSGKLDTTLTIIRDFEDTNPKRKYLSDFEAFVQESKLEDFYNENGETIFVSTIHKAKGKEFDNVFLLLENVAYLNEKTKRQLYVGMTRARKTLAIHLNGSYLDDLYVEDLVRINNDNLYSPPKHLAVHLTHKDVNLSYFGYIQHKLTSVMCGDKLLIADQGCTDSRGVLLVKFSKKFLEDILELSQKGYRATDARVNWMLLWKSDEMEREIKILLPEIEFERSNNKS